MTCLIASAPVGRDAERARTWLLRMTCAVPACSSSSVRGTSTTWIEPLIMRPVYCDSGGGAPEPVHSAGGVTGWRLPHGLGPAPLSFVFVITSCLPSGVTSTSAGYQEVGRKPVTLRDATSTTAIAFSPANAT